MAEKPGPKTPAGIAISSQNARIHGMTSTILLLPTESQDDLDAHIAQWHLLYPTTNEITQRLVTRAAQSEWHLLRLERQFNTASSQLLATPITDWDESHHKLYQNIQRYLTTGQRAHHRDRLNIQQYRAEIRCEEAHQARMENARASSAELPSFKPPVPPYDFHVNQDISLELDETASPMPTFSPPMSTFSSSPTNSWKQAASSAVFASRTFP